MSIELRKPVPVLGIGLSIAGWDPDFTSGFLFYVRLRNFMPMKLHSSLLLLLITIPPCAAQTSADMRGGNSKELADKGLKRLMVEKAIIRYEVEGQPNDTLITVFDRFGWRELILEFGNKTYYGMKTSVNTKTLVDGEIRLTMNLENQTGKVVNDSDLVKLAGYKSPDELFLARMSQLKATKIGLEVILNKECQIWEYTSRGKLCKLWAWNGLELKHFSASTKKTAIELNLDPLIEDKIFSVPEEINWN